ncbi:MAG: UDP-3-O-(3-hydroxymyristoyl)glucosamine N-acyltransferase [Burkholderiales bacterium]|nr:UDP-3-O-(3-hydroxymyristoyl)glucosamine N-acyltransferase [Burkholderiales bacterium]MDE2288874.1 UDP-3-O-(3-hydroxymyristoyl)glucosamine N-acyltransferase [Burkholderiales bacterium]
MTSFSLADLVAKFGGELIGDGGTTVTGLAPLDRADASQLAFLSNPLYLNQVASSRAGAVILARGDFEKVERPSDRNWIIAANPYAYFARVAQLLAASNAPAVVPGVHASATIDPSAQIAASASIGPNTVIEDGVRIGERVRIQANCFIGRGTVIGDDTLIYANVTLYHGSVIGARNILHAGVVIGADGFGFAPDFSAQGGEWVKIPQVGRAVLEDDVEIGASTSIDRGAMADTVIERGCKIDNQVQIGHNVRVGAYTVIAGCTGIAGSTTIGRYCMIGGAVGIAGHVTIADRVTITAKSGVTKSIPKPGIYSGSIAATPHAEWNKNAAIVHNLDKMRDRIKQLEAIVKDLQNTK